MNRRDAIIALASLPLISPMVKTRSLIETISSSRKVLLVDEIVLHELWNFFPWLSVSVWSQKDAKLKLRPIQTLMIEIKNLKCGDEFILLESNLEIIGSGSFIANGTPFLYKNIWTIAVRDGVEFNKKSKERSNG